MHECCAGIDVHQAKIVVCALVGAAGKEVRKEIATFGTTTRELLGLLDWLQKLGVSHVAIESTGVYWKPVYNILEGSIEVWLVNAQEVSKVPGRKTDVTDSEWLADLMRHGLLRRSFIPPPEIRELREYTRYRRTLMHTRSSEVNRLQKLLEDANIKLASVASDVMGVSGRQMLEAMAKGETEAEVLADMAKGALKKKREQLVMALEGRLRRQHRFLLRQLLDHVAFIDARVSQITGEIERVLAPFAEMVERLCEHPGIAARTVQDVLAEIGTDMKVFPTDAHLSSWAGLCPGNHESAGKRKTGRTRKANPWLKTALVEAAWGASNTKASYYYAQYRRLKARRGAKKAVVAVAHSILVTLYHMISENLSYKDLGRNYFDDRNKETIKRRLVRRLQDLGFDVEVKDKAAA